MFVGPATSAASTIHSVSCQMCSKIPIDLLEELYFTASGVVGDDCPAGETTTGALDFKSAFHSPCRLQLTEKETLGMKMGGSNIVPRANEENFGFAFNDFDFSDRVLRLEIIPNHDESIDSSKNLRVDKYHEWFSSINVDQCKDSKSYDGAKVVRLHINSVVLAVKSPFFYKLFKNGMKESQNKNDVSLRISASEERTLMDLLNFMYGNKLRATSATDLVDLLIAADKFEVTSCMRHSIQMLMKLPMSLEDAVFYLELPSSVLMSDIVQPLIDEAKKYIVARYKDLTKKSLEEAMKLPLCVLEVVLESEGLRADSEDGVFNFILEWARDHYLELEERRDILTNRLSRFVCFSNMSSPKLKEVLACLDFDHEHVSKQVVEALFAKVEHSCGQHVHATTNCHCSKRVYNNPRFVVHMEHCVVYFDLNKEECADLFTSRQFESQSFCLGGKRLYLSAHYSVKEDSFGLYLHREAGSETCNVDCEFEVKKKSSNEFESKGKLNRKLENLGWGFQDLLKIPWTEFMSDNSDYFIDGILHLRAKITLVNNAQP